MKPTLWLSKIWRFKSLLIIAVTTAPSFYAASAAGGELLLDSSESSTQVSIFFNGKREPLGVTPFSVKDRDLEGKVLLAEKTGFVPVYAPIFQNPKGRAEIHFELKRLNDWMPEEINTRIQQRSEDIVDQVFFAQSLIDEHKYKEALDTTETLRTQFPGSISIRILYANALLLNGQSTKAQSVYKSLLEEIPAQRTKLRSQIEQLSKKLSLKGEP